MDKENTVVNTDVENQDNSIDISNDETSDKSDNSQENSDELETLKKRYSDSSREWKRIMSVHKAYREVLKDNSKLLDLDKNIAKDVVAQLYEDWYSETKSLDELIEGLKWDTDWKIDKDELAKEIRAQILDEQNQEQSQKVLDEKLKNFDSKTKKLFLDEFNEVVWDRKITPAFTKREINKIIAYYKKQSSDDENFSNFASNWITKGKPSSTTTMSKAKLNSMGIPKDQQKALYPELFTK